MDIYENKEYLTKNHSKVVISKIDELIYEHPKTYRIHGVLMDGSAVCYNLDGEAIKYNKRFPGFDILKSSDDCRIGDDSLKNLYSLAFTKINQSIIDHYKSKYSGSIGLIIKNKAVIILKNGKYFESIRLDKIDHIFNSIDVKTLRKNLKEM